MRNQCLNARCAQMLTPASLRCVIDWKTRSDVSAGSNLVPATDRDAPIYDSHKVYYGIFI